MWKRWWIEISEKDLYLSILPRLSPDLRMWETDQTKEKKVINPDFFSVSGLSPVVLRFRSKSIWLINFRKNIRIIRFTPPNPREPQDSFRRAVVHQSTQIRLIRFSLVTTE